MATVLLGTIQPTPLTAATDTDQYVRTANYFLMSGGVLDSSVTTLSRFDLIVIPVEAQIYNKSFFETIRAKNPDIVILAYIATVSWNDLYWSDPLHQQLFSGIQSDWWLKDGNGDQASVWPGTRALNLNTGWREHLVDFVDESVLPSGLWDGIFFDEVQDSISWLGNVDVDKDGSQDSTRTADRIWAEQYEALFKDARTTFGSDTIIITNGSSNPDFAPHVNGRMFETFPSSNNALSHWENQMEDYLEGEDAVGYDPIHIINVNTENTGNKDDYQAVRFGLTSTLLAGGYFAFDYGTENHAQLWEYDEYDVYLGAPKTNLQSATSLQSSSNPQITSIDQDIWFRDFENGKVIVNATSHESTIELDGEFETIQGTQDPEHNNGRFVTEITLASQDGIILLRPVEDIYDATFLNGSFARIFTPDGETRRNGFFAYDSTQRGGMQVIRYDLNHDGLRETISADDTYVYIYESDGTLRTQIAPYTEGYNKGINISVGDIEDDGTIEIVTGTENGGGPHVRVFDHDGNLINPGFFAYADSFRGGVNVSIGDLNGDGIKEIICGAGVTGGPHVRVFKKDGTLINPGFFAYEESFRGGVNVSVGDTDGDGIDDIVTGPGVGGSPLARIFDRDGNMKSEFYVFDTSDASGLEVVATDIDGDTIAEIIGLTTDVFTLSIF